MNNFKYILPISVCISSFIFASGNIPIGPQGPENNSDTPKKRQYQTLQKTNKGKSYFEYDAPNGWWWYQEEVVQKDGKKVKVKTKMTKKEKLNFENKKETNELLKEQVDLLKDVKKRLVYAFPYVTPIYTKDERTGEKCLTNSSEYCFMLPIQAEAQRVPVMAEWLKQPSPTNSKKWLRWEAKYFNHLQKISLGNRFAYLSGGAKAYPTNTMYSMGDSVRSPLSARAREIRKGNIIAKLNDKLEILVLMGKTSVIDSLTKTHLEIGEWNRPEFKKWNVHFIFESEYSLKLFESNVKDFSRPRAREYWKSLKEKKLVFVSPKYFKKFNISVTPSVVAIYKTDKKEKDEKGKETEKNEMIWQNILTASINPVLIKSAIFRFLEYNGIVKAKDLAIDVGFGSMHKNVKVPEPEIKENKIYKDTQRIK